MNASVVEDRSAWESFIAAHAPQSLFAGWEWGEVERKLGHTVYRLGWYDGQRLTAIATAIVVNGKRGRMLHLRHGPVMARWSAGSLSPVREDAVELGKRERCCVVRMSPLTLDPACPGLLTDAGMTPAPIHGMDAQRCLVLDLSPSEDAIMAGFRKSTRYDIRKGESSGITVSAGSDARMLPEFLSLYDVTAKRQGFLGHDGIPEEYEVFGQRGDCEIITAYRDGTPVSSAVILYYRDQGIYHHGASVPGGPPASPLVQWEAIRRAKGRGLARYNFWGISPSDKPDHPWHGLSLFKRGFGGTEIVYPSSYDLPLTPAYAVIRTLETIRKRTKGY